MASKITLPTYITLTRFVLVPIFIYFFFIEKYGTAVLILLMTGLTDVLDGFLARRLNMRSRLGSLLDPMADKFLMVLSFLVLAFKGIIPWWLAGVVLGKDAIVTFGVIILNLMRVRLYYRPTILSKMTTGGQILVLLISFLIAWLLTYPFFSSLITLLLFFKTIIIAVTVILTLATAVQYTWIGVKFYRYGERKS